MYTDEDKVFCVKRMWAEGLTPTAASRLWGAPSRRTLAAWEKEALGGGLAVEAPRVPGACRRAKHARYPEDVGVNIFFTIWDCGGNPGPKRGPGGP